MGVQVSLFNYTPHQIDVVMPDGSIYSIPPCGAVARVEEETKGRDSLAIELPRETANGRLAPREYLQVPLAVVEYGPVVRVDEQGKAKSFDPTSGNTYLVSRLVFDRMPTKTNLVCPGPLVRDADGKPIGCKGLIGRFAPYVPDPKRHAEGSWDGMW